ncbi:hypothetical protein UPYG_G00152670 [Umbra pygmaea]|uniref:Uncharacterized protein n=1 Tax=Umbra pygmaea TaxID=75934 RepID=A0ABD0WYK3_UMBPY
MDTPDPLGRTAKKELGALQPHKRLNLAFTTHGWLHRAWIVLATGEATEMGLKTRILIFLKPFLISNGSQCPPWGLTSSC